MFATRRKLRVLLPPSYVRERAARFPVLYLNDGQNLFDHPASLSGESWRVHEIVPDLIARGRIAPILVVGIDNAGRDRAREYMPHATSRLADPRGRLYPRFLLDEVVPFIEKRYRVDAGRAGRVLGGSSLGAGIALFAAMRRTRAFSGLLLESPSGYAGADRVAEDAARVTRWPDRVFIGTGTVRDTLAEARRLKRLLADAGLGRERLKLVIGEGARHTESAWADRLPRALEFLFPP